MIGWKTSGVAVAMMAAVGVAYGQTGGPVICWGDNTYGQCDVPEPNEGFVAVAAGEWHSLGLKADGSVVCWGLNDDGQCDIPDSGPYIAIDGGAFHSVGLRAADGCIMCWGYNGYGQCDPPLDPGFTAIAAGGFHNVALKDDSTIVCWGYNGYGQCNPPSGDYWEIIGAGQDFSMAAWHFDPNFPAIIECWGDNTYGQCEPPTELWNVSQLDGAWDYGVALGDLAPYYGYVEMWYMSYPPVPSPNDDWVSISTYDQHVVGLKDTGQIICWGDNDYGQCDVPEPNEDFVGVAAGMRHSVGLKAPPVSVEDVTAAALQGYCPTIAVAPNPVTSSAIVTYSTTQLPVTHLQVIDVSGRFVQTLAEGSSEAGEHSVVFDTVGLAPGVYFVRLTAGSQVVTARVVVVR